MTEIDLSEYRRQRLAELVRVKFAGNKAEAGRALGFRDGAYVSQMLKGIRPITEKFIAGAHAATGLAGWFNVPIANYENQLRTGERLPSYTPAIELDANPDYPTVRRVRFKLSAGASGFGIEYLDHEGPPIVFQKNWFVSRQFNPAKLFATKVSNGSMETGLYDGDTVIVNTESITPKDGVVFAANFEGELVIKRLVRDAGQWWLSSDNPDQRRYPRKLCDDNVHLIGEVVHKQSERI